MWPDPELRKLYDEVTGLKNAVKGGFDEMRWEIGAFRRIYIPLIFWIAAATIIGLVALSIALDNRAIINRQLKEIQRSVNTIQQGESPSYTPPARP